MCRVSRWERQGKVQRLFLFCFLSEKLVQRKSAHANTGNGKSDLVNGQAHHSIKMFNEMAYVLLCFVTVTSKLAENFVSLYLGLQFCKVWLGRIWCME